jgi:hypothetical protein
MGIIKTVSVTILLAVLHSVPLYSTGSVPVSTDSVLILPQLIKEFGHFISDDYTRSQNPEEERINWLIEQSEKLDYKRGIALGNNLLGVIYRDRSEIPVSSRRKKYLVQILENLYNKPAQFFLN